MSVGMSLLSILDEGANYGLRLKQEFEARTGGVWDLNVGQVYTTLDRLERDGLVRQVPETRAETQKMHEITDLGRERLQSWFSRPAAEGRHARDALVLKLVMAARNPGVDPQAVIQAERRGAIEELREYTALKRDTTVGSDLGWLFLIDSLIFKTEARVRWLDACEARLERSARAAALPHLEGAPAAPAEQPNEVLR